MVSRKTSKAVYKQIQKEGLLSDRRWQVYSTLFEIGPATAAEISLKDQGSFTNPAKGDNSHARLSELKLMGCVEEVGEKVCSVTGRQVILWDVTSNLPVKFEPKASRAKKVLDEAQSLIAAIECILRRPVSYPRKVKEIALEINKAKEKIEVL